jgi:putative transposase
MADKFKNKYRIDSGRLRNWDYSWNSAYFITICTKNREHSFGKINAGEMILSDIGNLANNCWLEIPQHFPFVKLGDHVIMPNHVHGIVVIEKTGNGQDCVSTDGIDDLRTGSELRTVVETQDFASLPSPILPNRPPTKNKFGPQSRNLGSIIRGFKIGVTIKARPIDPSFSWQSRYHDHIIRDEKSYLRISNYINLNPLNWKDDTF